MTSTRRKCWLVAHDSVKCTFGFDFGFGKHTYLPRLQLTFRLVECFKRDERKQNQKHTD